MRLIVNDLDNWSQCKEPLLFSGVNHRTIEFHLNCEEKTSIWAQYGEKGKEKLKFVGVVKAGNTAVRLDVSGNLWLVFKSEGEVWYYDPVGRNVRRQAPEQRKYTGPLNRQERNPEMERMFEKLEGRFTNQLRLREAKMEQQLAQARSEAAKGTTVNPDTGEVTENGDNKPETGTGEAGSTEQATGSGTGEGEKVPAEGQGTSAAAPTTEEPKVT